MYTHTHIYIYIYIFDNKDNQLTTLASLPVKVQTYSRRTTTPSTCTHRSSQNSQYTNSECVQACDTSRTKKRNDYTTERRRRRVSCERNRVGPLTSFPRPGVPAVIRQRVDRRRSRDTLAATRREKAGPRARIHITRSKRSETIVRFTVLVRNNPRGRA